MRSASPPRTKRPRVLHAFNSVTLLPFATIASLGDFGMSMVRTGSFKAWKTAVHQFVTEPEYRRAAQRMGVSIENIVHEALGEIHGGKMGRFMNGFFWANGLTPWTNAQRQISVLVNFEALRAHQEVAQIARQNR